MAPFGVDDPQILGLGTPPVPRGFGMVDGAWPRGAAESMVVPDDDPGARIDVVPCIPLGLAGDGALGL